MPSLFVNVGLELLVRGVKKCDGTKEATGGVFCVDLCWTGRRGPHHLVRFLWFSD